MTALLGRLLNRLGHRLVRWGYALEMRAWRRQSFRYKVTFVDAKGNEVPYSPGPSDGGGDK